MSRSFLRPDAPAPFAPPDVDRERKRKSECADCGRKLTFVTMESGRLMPCDPVQVYGDGRRHLVERYLDARGNVVGRLITKAPEDVLGLVPHFGSCPCRKRKVVIAQPTLFDALPAGAQPPPSEARR